MNDLNERFNAAVINVGSYVSELEEELRQAKRYYRRLCRLAAKARECEYKECLKLEDLQVAQLDRRGITAFWSTRLLLNALSINNANISARKKQELHEIARKEELRKYAVSAGARQEEVEDLVDKLYSMEQESYQQYERSMEEWARS